MTSFLSKSIVAGLFALPAVLAVGSPLTCSNPQTSCQNTTAVADLCCFNAPGGQLVQTQFWDTSPSTGPSNSWTIHGLWPDHCDGTYDANCDASRAYTDITAILQSYGKTDLLAYMNTYWVDLNGNNQNFWSHEWGKHGTCISTLKTSCYTGYTPQEEVVDYFQKTVDLFKTLDSYTALANAGIIPSSTKTYTSAAIKAALKASFGYDVTIQCASGALDEIWYSYDVRGSVQTGTFLPAAPVGQSSTCASSGIKYLPKSGAAASTTLKTSTTTASGTGSGSSPTSTGSFSGTGYLNAITSGSQTGCLISAGTWYTTGTCATYTATASGWNTTLAKRDFNLTIAGSGFTLKTSKGSCGISSSTFSCGSSVTASVFTASGGYLAYGGSTTFYATAVPSGSTQATVYTSSQSVSVQFQWQSK